MAFQKISKRHFLRDIEKSFQEAKQIKLPLALGTILDMILSIRRIKQLILQIMVFFLPSLGGPSNCRRRDSTYHVP